MPPQVASVISALYGVFTGFNVAIVLKKIIALARMHASERSTYLSIRLHSGFKIEMYVCMNFTQRNYVK